MATQRNFRLIDIFDALIGGLHFVFRCIELLSSAILGTVIIGALFLLRTSIIAVWRCITPFVSWRRSYLVTLLLILALG